MPRLGLVAQSGRAKVLIAPWHRPSLANMAKLYSLYAEQEWLEPCLLATSREIGDELRGLVGNQATIHEYFVEQVFNSFSSPPLSRILGSALYHLGPSWISHYLRCRRELEILRALARSILDKASPDLLVVEDDRRLNLLPLVHEAKKRGCYVLVIPYGISSTKKDLLVERQSRPDKLLRQGTDRFVKRAIAALWPKVVIGQGRETAFFYRAEETLALRSLSMLPDDPFLLGNFSDLVLIGGKFDFESLRNDGVPPEKLVITGELEHDELAKSNNNRALIRDNLIKKYGLRPDHSIVLVCIPQIQNEQLMPLDKQKEERRRLVRAASGPGRNVLLSLHPKLNPIDCMDLTHEFRVAILTEKLKDVLAAVDLYISNHSSTVRWSLMLQIPTLVVDFNGNEERIFSDLTPAIKTCSMDELFDEVADLFERPANLSDQQHYQKQLQDFFGFLDGRAGKRIIDVTSSIFTNAFTNAHGAPHE